MTFQLVSITAAILSEAPSVISLLFKLITYQYDNILKHSLCIMIRYFEFHIVIHQLMCLHAKETRECCLVCILTRQSYGLNTL